MIEITICSAIGMVVFGAVAFIGIKVFGLTEDNTNVSPESFL